MSIVRQVANDLLKYGAKLCMDRNKKYRTRLEAVLAIEAATAVHSPGITLDLFTTIVKQQIEGGARCYRQVGKNMPAMFESN